MPTQSISYVPSDTDDRRERKKRDREKKMNGSSVCLLERVMRNFVTIDRHYVDVKGGHIGRAERYSIHTTIQSN